MDFLSNTSREFEEMKVEEQKSVLEQNTLYLLCLPFFLFFLRSSDDRPNQSLRFSARCHKSS